MAAGVAGSVAGSVAAGAAGSVTGVTVTGGTGGRRRSLSLDKESIMGGSGNGTGDGGGGGGGGGGEGGGEGGDDGMSVEEREAMAILAGSGETETSNGGDAGGDAGGDSNGDANGDEGWVNVPDTDTGRGSVSSGVRGSGGGGAGGSRSSRGGSGGAGVGVVDVAAGMMKVGTDGAGKSMI